MKRVLVTGASGFIGAHALGPLVAAGYDVHAVARTPRTSAPAGAVTWHAADLLEPGSAEPLMAHVRATHLLHLAWYAEPGRFWMSPLNFQWVEASLALVRAFVGAGGTRVVAAGTCAEYDWTTGAEHLEETAPALPATTYGVAKLALARLLLEHARVTGTAAAWGRVFHLHGPTEDPRRLIVSTMASLAQGDTAACSSGEQRRDFLHVEDVGAAFAALLDSDVTGVVNIGSGEGIAVRDVVTRVAGRMHALDRLRLGAVPRQPGEPDVLVPDVTRLTREVGWRPRFGIADGLDATVDAWVRANAVPR